MHSQEPPLLSVNNIEVLYGHVILALRNVSLLVPKGKVVTVLGGNGAGKTTTLKACSNLLRAERGAVTKGSILLDGKDIANLSPYEVVKAGVVQVLQGRHCFTGLTVEENLLIGSFIRRADRASVERDLEFVYDRFKLLAKLRARATGLLSGGEQQMVAIGRALMARPRLILLDEPSTGLAPQLVEEIFEIVRRLNEKDCVSFLVAEQNVRVGLRYAHFGYALENGRVTMMGRATDIATDPAVRQLYMGMGESGRRSFKDVKFYNRRARDFVYR